MIVEKRLCASLGLKSGAGITGPDKAIRVELPALELERKLPGFVAICIPENADMSSCSYRVALLVSRSLRRSDGTSMSLRTRTAIEGSLL